MANDTPILYVFVRTDMPSMTPGKAQAHSGHAANAFVHKHVVKKLQKNKLLDPDVLKWTEATEQGFGTQINLKGNWADVCKAHEAALAAGVITDVVLDPTYPYIVDAEMVELIKPAMHAIEPIALDNGKFVCHRPENTAIYFFGMKDQLKPFVGDFPLHP